MRTPLSRVRGLGSAKHGTSHFWRQRLTAAANIPLALFLVWLAVSVVGSEAEQVRAVLASPFVTIGLALALASMLYHMNIGMQVIIEDYASERTKIPLLAANIFLSAALGAIAAYALLKLMTSN